MDESRAHLLLENTGIKSADHYSPSLQKEISIDNRGGINRIQRKFTIASL